jgi:hypothetical protein
MVWSVKRNSKNEYGTDRGLRVKATLSGALVVAAGAAALAGGATAQAGVPAAAAAAAPHWQIVYRTHSATFGELDSVTAPTKNDAWAAGVTGASPVILNWNGKSWKSVKVPGTAGFEPGQFGAVQATSASDVWITGNVAHSAVGQAHVWNGKTWRTIDLPTSGFEYSAVVSASDVWGSAISSEGCYNGTAISTCLYHWSGAKWTETRLADDVTDMTAAGHHAWLLGLTDLRNPGSSNPSGIPVIYEATNGKLRKVPAPAARIQSYDSMAAAPGGQLWIEASLATAKAPATLFHWTGKRWTEATISELAGGYQAVVSGAMAYDGKDGVWIGGLLHWTGSKWVNTFASVPWEGSFGLNAAAPIPGSSSIWTVGDISRTNTSQTLDPLVAAYGPLP